MDNIFEKIASLDLKVLLEPLEELHSCNICPRACRADRFSSKLGYCNADASFRVSSVFPHLGEEPVISGSKGICNVFFTNCNLQCIYCQNHQISCNKSDYSQQKINFTELIQRIVSVLSEGINHVGFVSPSHYIPHIKAIINAIRSLGLDPVFVYNTNAYDKTDSIRGLENYIDIYLPDFKYADEEIARRYSDAKNYPATALHAIGEMLRQKGEDLPLNTEGYAMRGLVIRHLVLPGHADNSINVLRAIAEKLSNRIHISLMSQYYPTYQVKHHEFLGRVLKPKEYYRVVDEMDKLGFENGWVQELSSHESYRPDFESEKPFELT
jgi:putative pyruvate formate lyase activating enzyme